MVSQPPAQRGPATPAPQMRVGVGTDVHRLVEGRPMRMAGLAWPDEALGPEGHSDGDVVLHACCDALYSAAGLGDLGTNVGTGDPRWAGASGHDLLAEALRRVHDAGWQVANIACQLVGNRPKLAPRRAEAEAGLLERHGVVVTLSSTTTDGLGLTGRGEGVAAVATALLVRVPEQGAHPSCGPARAGSATMAG